MSGRAVVFSIVLSLMVATPGFAQLTTEIGVKGGMNIATATQVKLDPLANKAGAVGGVYLRATQNDMGIQTEVLFSTQGGNRGGGHNFDLKLTYIQVPVLAYIGLPFGFGQRVRPFVSGGGVFGGRLSVDIDSSVSTDPDNDFKKSDVGMAIGGGVTVSKKLSVEGRYFQGLRDNLTERGHKNPGIGSGDIKNRVISLMVGVAIPRWP